MKLPPAVAWRLLPLLGLALVLPSLRAGFFADDYVHIAALEGWSAHSSHPLDLYSFMPRDPAAHERLRHLGVLPWFTAPGLRLTFFRPLSSALTWLDHGLWGRWPLPYHLHTLLWYAAVLGLAAALLRRALPAGLGLLALLLFCLDDAHATAASWVAARSATVACTFALAGLLAHIGWRQRGWRAGAVLAPAAAALALAAGEMALAMLAYLVAWELVGRRPGWTRALVPTGALVLVYLIVYGLVGAGARDSGGYLDPFGDPRGFLAALPGRLLLLLGGLGGAPIDLVLLEPSARWALLLAGALFGLLVAVWLPGALRRMAPEEAQGVRWLGLGALASLLVGVPALPGERVLLAASLGGAVVLAALLRDGWRLLAARQRRFWAAGGLLAVALSNLLLPAILLPVKSAWIAGFTANYDRLARDAEIQAPVPARVVVVALEDLLAIQLPALRAVQLGHGAPELRRVRAALERAAASNIPVHDVPLPDRFGYRYTTVLSLAGTDHRLKRVSADTLELATPAGTLFDSIWAETLRSPSLGLGRGSVIRLRDFTATVLDDRDGRPTRVSFRFDRPLDDPSLVFLALKDGGLRRLSLPAPGEELLILRPRVLQAVPGR